MPTTSNPTRSQKRSTAKNAAAARVFSASVDRAARILMVLSGSSEPLALPSISRLAGIEKSTTFRILCTLVAEGVVAQDQMTGAYSLGFLSSRSADIVLGTLRIRELASPVIRQICEQIDETTVLSVRDGWQRVNLDYLDSRQSIVQTQQIGVPFPLHIGAPGLVVLAGLPPEERERYFTTEEFQLTAVSANASDFLRARLKEAMQKPYVVSIGECTAGGVLLAAPLLDASRSIAGAIHVAVPLGRWSPEMEKRCADVVVGAARTISDAMQSAR